jgi:hypothetical protein
MKHFAANEIHSRVVRVILVLRVFRVLRLY